MIEFLHDLPFVDDGLDLLLSGQLVLSHDLHGVETTGVLLSDEDDPTEGTSSDHFYLFEVMAGHLKLGILFLSESQFGEMGPEELAIVKAFQGPIILS